MTQGAWGRIGGAAAVLVGIGFGFAAWRGPEREVIGLHAVPCYRKRPALGAIEAATQQ
jgi:hypothetical protein